MPVGAQMLSILDETENSFVWEHIQAYQEQASGAWLGISVNTKGEPGVAREERTPPNSGNLL